MAIINTAYQIFPAFCHLIKCLNYISVFFECGKVVFLVNELWATVIFVISEQGHLIDNFKSSKTLSLLSVLEVVGCLIDGTPEWGIIKQDPVNP